MPELSPGCAPPSSQAEAGPSAAVMIFDLDGTVLSVNSFPLWVLFMLRGAAVSGSGWHRLQSAAEIARIAWLLGQRKAGLIGHEELKRRLQLVWKAMVLGDGGVAAARFVARLQRHLRPSLAAVLSAARDGRHDAVLATAAPDDYAVPLGAAIGLSHVVATGSGRSRDQPGNVGAHKRDAVLQFLMRQGWQDRPRLLFTDHPDDLPLMAVCQEVFWFGSAAHERRVRRMLPDVCLLPACACEMLPHGVRRTGADTSHPAFAGVGTA
jgi:phosphoserine phosphatase